MLRITVLVVVTLALSLSVQAKSVQAKQKKAKDHRSTRDSTVEQGNLDKSKTFSPAERNLIRAYLLSEQRTTAEQQKKNLPPGLQKKIAHGKPLPPGWQKKVEPGQSLDYQVYRQGKSLPDILLKRLPSPPDGSEIIQAGEKVILLNSTTRKILDTFDLVPER